MASSGKRKTTMAKLTRERRLHERRLDKQAKKAARNRASAHQPIQPSDGLTAGLDEPDGPEVGQPDLNSLAHAPSSG